MKKITQTLISMSVAALIASCSTQPSDSSGTSRPAKSDVQDVGAITDTRSAEGLVSFKEFQLANGLKVIFHIDRSDPVVSVALTSHVGSAREKPGRTGFAHLFEHLLFLESENLGKGGLDKLSARIGGSGANGSTSRDRTNYFQTVPKDALEKMIWAEADKLGFFINTVTEPVLAKEKQVVKNEKRQGVDNQPYGHTQYVIDKHLYPEGHPYSWQVIGSLEDLQNATLADVKEFFNQWYVPNNVTLTIAGDFDTEQATVWVKKYFDEIPRGQDIASLDKQPVELKQTKQLYYEDNFARSPELRLTWPTVPQYAPDSYALNVLADLLTVGKAAPMNQVLIDDKKIAPQLFMGDYSSELAGQMSLIVRAFDGVDLDDAKSAIDVAFEKFEREGIAQKDLDRVKTAQEVNFYNGIQSVLGKAFQLAQYDIFAGDAAFINQDIKNIQAVTIDDVKRVYSKYIKKQSYIATSFVPKGMVDLALAGSNPANVPEEVIVAGAEEEFDASIEADYERTASRFDRTIEPPYGDAPTLSVPDLWDKKASNGLRILGIEDNELPLIQFEMAIEGGHLLDSTDKPGVANLVAIMLTKGTLSKTTAEFEEAVTSLGASIDVNATNEEIVISGSTLARNFGETIDLLQDLILNPRWDEQEFALAKASVANQISGQAANPNAIANNAYSWVTYGAGHILSMSILGTASSIDAIQLVDLKSYYENHLSPSVSIFRIVGAVDSKTTDSELSNLVTQWKRKDVVIPQSITSTSPQASKVYFYDVPGAKQSVLRFGYPGPKRSDDDFYAARVMNYILGGGGFASRLTQELREGKGYTYGIGSGFNGTAKTGSFSIGSGVRSNVTYDATKLIIDILKDYGNTYTTRDLEVTKSFLIKSKARSFETLAAKLTMLENISRFGLAQNYVVEQDKVVNDMDIQRIRSLATEYIKPNQMNYVVVGDAATQLEGLKALGFGEPILLNDKLAK
jgi:zinc protease